METRTLYRCVFEDNKIGRHRHVDPATFLLGGLDELPAALVRYARPYLASKLIDAHIEPGDEGDPVVGLVTAGDRTVARFSVMVQPVL